MHAHVKACACTCMDTTKRVELVQLIISNWFAELIASKSDHTGHYNTYTTSAAMAIAFLSHSFFVSARRIVSSPSAKTVASRHQDAVDGEDMYDFQ